jgi:hypothetical protein
MLDAIAYLALMFGLLAIAAALWVAGTPKVEPREHLRIRNEIDGGRLYALDDWRDAA